jgi:tetrahydromethanopterin S-methyltransferase subunit G
MQHEIQLKRHPLVFENAWFMWLWMIIFPPLGIAIMWRQGRLSIKKKLIGTLLALFYFLFPFIIGSFVTVPLYYSHEEFLKAFNKEKEDLKLQYTLSNTVPDKQTISSKIGKDISLIENIDETGQIHEIIMVGQSEGTDIVIVMGLLIGMVSPELSSKEVGEVLSSLRLFDTTYPFEMRQNLLKTAFVIN